MSVIVAIKENGIVYMGADTQATMGNKKENLLNETAFKIVKLNNGILVGFCGSYKIKQEILSDESIFTLDENKTLTKHHIVNHIVPKLSKWLKKFDKNEALEIGVDFLIAHNDNLYQISSTLDIVKINNITKIGSGKGCVDYALTYFKFLPIKERISKALAESANITEGVSGPYVLIDTIDKIYEIIDLKGENH